MTKEFKLSELIAETYVSDEKKFMGYADRGNGSGFGEGGQVIEYDEKFSDVVLKACLPIKGEDGQTEFAYASGWLDGDNGYQYRILF